MARYNYGYLDDLRMKRKRRKVRIAFLVISSLVVFIVFATYALFFSGWLTIKEIRVNGNEEISSEEINALIDGYLYRSYFLGHIKLFSNILFTSSKNIEESLRDKFPKIETVKVDKNLFAKNLTVNITERGAVGIWCKSGEDRCFYFDKDLVLFKAAPKFSGEFFLTVEDGRGRDFNLSDSFDDRELLEKIILTRSILDELKVVNYNGFFLPEGSFEFWLKTKEGWNVYLDKGSDIATQIVALKKFLDEKLSASRRQTLEYVDLRINNRIYYK